MQVVRLLVPELCGLFKHYLPHLPAALLLEPECTQPQNWQLHGDVQVQRLPSWLLQSKHTLSLNCLSQDSSRKICVKTTVNNCLVCQTDSTNVQNCTLCNSTYLPTLSGNQVTCKALATTKSINYFVKGGAPLLLANFNYDASQSGIGVSPAKAFLFIQEAINAVHLYQQSNYLLRVDAVIYLGKGDHFFFQCDGDETTFANQNYSAYVNYCSKLSLAKPLVLSDNVHFRVTPLYCSLGATLSLSKNADFLSMCISSTDALSRPTVSVNHRNSHFNVSGYATFESVVFSGANAFAVPTIATEDYSIFPAQLCAVSATPFPGDNLIKLSKVAQTQLSQLQYDCLDRWYPRKSTIPSNSTTQLRCLANKYKTFYPGQQSTLACTNDIGTSDDFFWSQTDSMSYSKRRATLFNLYAFADYLTAWQQPPALTLKNCDFQYFMGGYTNLVNVEHNSLTKISKVNTVTLLNQQTTQQMDFFTSWQGQRGASIWVESCSFAHSRFCSGMITYRKQSIIPQFKSFTNFTDHIKNYTNYSDTGSFIVLKSSKFNNLNYLTNVSALAIYDGVTPTRSFTGQNSLEAITFRAQIHKGIVLNVEDYNGSVQVEDCTFTNNMHFIPEVMVGPYARTLQKDINQFRDSYSSQEYKMTTCNNDLRKDLYLFQHGIAREDSFNNYFDKFERLGLLYISRPTQPVVVTGSLFRSNMGTFGGAITINSPVWVDSAQSGFAPYVYINNTQFEQNLGYLSGNAVYVRNTFLTTNQQYVCAGVHISHSLFYHNIGMKNHNAGGMGVVCYYLSSTTHDDYLSTSSIRTPQALADSNNNATAQVQSVTSDQQFTVFAFQFAVHKCNFTENYSGQRGTGLYVSIVSKIRITESTFMRNGPVYGYTEIYTSPYSTVFSKRPLSFFDPSDDACYEEFNYINFCANADAQIDWSSVRGALHIAGCQESWCLNAQNIQLLLLQNTQFVNNQAGPYLDSTTRNDLAASIYIYGGFQNYIINCSFTNHSSSEMWFIQDLAPKIYRYFPPIYFTYAQAPVIRIRVVPKAFSSTKVLNFSTVCSNCSFVGNKHVQILGLNYEKQYYGSLINMDSDYNNGSMYAPSLTLNNSNIKDNQFIGNQTALVYLFKGLAYVLNSQAYGNGYLTKVVTSVQTLLGQSGTDGFFPFDSYKFQQYQNLGVFHLQGMEFFPSGLYHQFIGNSFAFNFAYQGAVYNLMIDNQFAMFRANRYSYNYVQYMGGVMYARNQDFRSTLVFYDEFVEYQFGETFGAFGLNPHDPNFLSVFFYNSTFRNNKATDGSSLYLDSLAAFTAVNLTFYEDNWLENTTAFVVSKFKQGQIKLYDFIDRDYMLYLTDQMPRLSGQVFTKKQGNSQDAYFLSTLLKKGSDPYAAYAEFIDCRFFNLTATYGAAIYVQESQQARVVVSKYDERTVIRNNTVTEYGAIYVTLSNDFLAENLTFKSNTATVRGSAVGVESAKAELRNCTFENNIARSKGTIYVSEDSSFSCDRCFFYSNWASEASAIFVINVDDANVTITNSEFRNNRHDQDLINFILSRGSISNSLFVDNFASKVNHGITLINSQLTVSNVSVNYTDPAFLYNNNYLVDAGFFSLNFNSQLLVQGNSRFENCRGAIGSVIYATGFSSVTFRSSVVKNCASQQGGSLYFTMTDQINIEDVRFENNTLNDVKLDNSNANVSQCTFSQGFSSFILAKEADLKVSNSRFEDGSNIDTSGKGIYCSCQTLNITNTTFSNLNALDGGAIYLTSTYKKSVFSIANSTFADNQAQHGGAIKVQDAAQLTLTGNTFLRNKAKVLPVQTALSSKLVQKGLGGALYFDCYNINANLANNCLISLKGSNTFDSNQAGDDGGSILWVGNRFTYDSSTKFVNNSANYGANIGSYSKSLVIQFVSNNDPLQPITNSTQYYKVAELQSQNATVRRLLKAISDNGGANLRDVYRFELAELGSSTRLLKGRRHSRRERALASNNVVSFQGIVSGTGFSFVIYILDQDENIYTSDSQSIAVLRSMTDDVVLQNFEANAQSGVYSFNDVILNIEPGQSAMLELDIQDLQTFANEIDFLITPVTFNIQTRRCLQGEAYTIDKSCVPCEENFYLYTQPSSEVSCNSCNPNAFCFGLNKVAPKPGYWRSSNTSTNFVQCENQYACLGGDENHPTGNCSLGYEDVMCGNCQPGYKKTSDFKCGICPSPAANAAQFAGLILVGVLVCAFLVRSNINSADKEKPLYTVYMKIMTNHFQMVSAISAIDYHWPNQIEELQSGQSSVTGSTDQVFSFDCFLQQNDQSSTTNSDKVYTQKLILFTVLPLILALVSVAVWMAAKVVRGRVRKIKDKIISTMVVLLFLVHPTIAKILFQAFNCVEVDGVNRLKSNISMVCYQGTHLVYLTVVVVPGILIWVIGIPLAALVMLIRNKKRILRMSTYEELTSVEKSQVVHLKMKYGFLFNGYQLGTFFWEVVILYRKILIIMVTVFFSVVSTEVQVLVVILIVITALLLQIKFKPYYTDVLNQMELYSLQVAVVTMYGGMFFITGAHYGYMSSNFLRWFFFLFILAPNLLFFFYWLHFMRIEVLKLLYQRNARLFRLLTCNRYKDNSFKERYLANQDQKNRWSVKFTAKNAEKLRGQDDGGVSITKGGDKTFQLEENDKTDFSNIDLITKGAARDDLDNSHIPQLSSMTDRDLLKDRFATSRQQQRQEARRSEQEEQDEASLQEIKLDFPMHMMKKIPDTYNRGNDFTSYAFNDPTSNDRVMEGEHADEVSFYQPQSRQQVQTQRRPESMKQKFKLHFPSNMLSGLASARGDKSSRRVMPESMANKLTARLTSRKPKEARLLRNGDQTPEDEKTNDNSIAVEENYFTQRSNPKSKLKPYANPNQVQSRTQSRDAKLRSARKDVDVQSANDDYIDSAQKILNLHDIHLEGEYKGVQSEAEDFQVRTKLGGRLNLPERRGNQTSEFQEKKRQQMDDSRDSELVLPSIVEQQQNISDNMSLAVGAGGILGPAEDRPQYDLFGNPVFPFQKAEPEDKPGNPFIRERKERTLWEKRDKSKSPATTRRESKLQKISNPFMAPGEQVQEPQLLSSEKKRKSKQRGFMFHHIEEESKLQKALGLQNQLSSGGPNSRREGQPEAAAAAEEDSPKKNRKKNRSRKRR